MMDIFLVRHGEAAASWGQSKDPGLSELGVRQASEACEFLRPSLSNNTALVSSPLARARETSAPLALAMDTTVSINSAFSEIPSTVPLEERQAWLRQFMQEQWNAQPGNLHEWRETAFAQLLDVQTPAVIYTHFLLINAVVGKILARPETLCFWPDNGSITHLRRTPLGLELVALGREMDTVVN